MGATEELWELYRGHIENAKFSLIAAQLLLEEAEKDMSLEDLKDYARRHKRHLRAMYQHLRQAKKIRKTIRKIERKMNG